jgi:hypothetical protein
LGFAKTPKIVLRFDRVYIEDDLGWICKRIKN